MDDRENVLDMAVDGFQRRAGGISGRWDEATPCEEWSVLDLVEHVITGNTLAVHLLEGGSAGTAPAPPKTTEAATAPQRLQRGARVQREAFALVGALKSVCDHPAGKVTGRELQRYRAADIAVHTWDLARALDLDEALDPLVVQTAVDYYLPWVASMPSSPQFKRPADAPTAGASAQHRLPARRWTRHRRLRNYFVHVRRHCPVDPRVVPQPTCLTRPERRTRETHRDRQLLKGEPRNTSDQGPGSGAMMDFMSHLDATSALHACETALRELMSHTFSQAYGPAWLDKVATPEKLAKWRERSEAETASRGKRGALGIPNAGLAYANFYDLVHFADKHWEPLAEALGAKRDTLALLRRIESLRNTIGHSRALLPFEQDLLSGIAGQIRNQVTIFMSAVDPVGDIYARIESITDSFGRRIESSTVDSEVAGSVTDYDIVLHPDEIVTFTCVGMDAQGRELEWKLQGQAGRSIEISCSSGDAALLTWKVRDEDVTETAAMSIYLSVQGAKYRRFGWFDHRAYFMFRVRPPVE